MFCGGSWVVFLGGSWVVISGVKSPLAGVIIVVALLITPLRTTHEPPSGATRVSPVCLTTLGPVWRWFWTS